MCFHVGNEPEKLDYETPQASPGAGGALGFYLAYAFGAVISFFGFGPAFHTMLRGRPGDEGVFVCDLLGIALLTVILIPLYHWWLGKVAYPYQLLIAGGIGCGAFLVGIGVALFVSIP